MELKAGYKQTEIGVIPEDWNLTTIGDLASVSSGGTPSRKNLAFWDGSIPWVTTTQINFNTITEANEFITEEGLKGSAAKLLSAGTLLLALYGQGKTRGKVAILGFEASTNQACASISLNDHANRNFVFHFLASQYDEIRNASNTGSQENLNGQIVKNIKIPLPPKAEQRAIATALSNVDALLTKLDALIAKKRDLKQAAMQQLLTAQTRLPGFSDTSQPYKESLIGLIPSDWDVHLLGNIGKFKNGINKGSDAFGHGHPFVNLMDVFGVSIIKSKAKFGLVKSSVLEQKTYDIKKGDVIFIRSSVKPSGVGLTAVVANDLPETVYSGFLIRFRDSDFIELEFKQHCFYSKNFRNQVIASSSVSANTNINQNSLAQLLLPLPRNKAEQNAIATVLSNMDAEITALEARRDKTRALKQGMMQELLTGKIRLL